MTTPELVARYMEALAALKAGESALGTANATVATAKSALEAARDAQGASRRQQGGDLEFPARVTLDASSALALAQVELAFCRAQKAAVEADRVTLPALHTAERDAWGALVRGLDPYSAH